MKPLPVLLAASLAMNAAAVAGYFATRRAPEPPAPPPVEAVLREIALTDAQLAQLRDLRRALRTELRPVRAELQPKFDAALTGILRASPDDPVIESLLRDTIDGRTKQLAVIAKHLVAFRATLTPAQRPVFDRHVGEWSFIQTLAGLRPPLVGGGPIGPFQQTEPPRAVTAPAAPAAAPVPAPSP